MTGGIEMVVSSPQIIMYQDDLSIQYTLYIFCMHKDAPSSKEMHLGLRLRTPVDAETPSYIMSMSSSKVWRRHDARPVTY